MGDVRVKADVTNSLTVRMPRPPARKTAPAFDVRYFVSGRLWLWDDGVVGVSM